MKPSPVAYYVTAHGFGHATRASAVIALLERRGLRVLVRTGAPAWLFADEGLAAEVTPAPDDPGLAMKDALTVDRPASLAAHEGILARWEEAAGAEAAWLRRAGAGLVVSDAGALAVDAARRAGAPAVVAANFTWDWIFEPYAADDRRWEAVRRRHAEAYAHAAAFLHLPMGGDGPALCGREEMPLVVRRTRLSREAGRRALGIAPDERRPLVAFSFGGIDGRGGGRLADDPLEDVLFVGYGPAPGGLRGEWRELPRRAALRHNDLVAAADAVFTKPGYGAFSECLAARVPALYIPRADFRECPLIVDTMRKLGRARAVSREDWEAGRWGAALRGLLAARDPWADIRLDGADAVAARLAAMLS